MVDWTLARMTMRKDEGGGVEEGWLVRDNPTLHTTTPGVLQTTFKLYWLNDRAK